MCRIRLATGVARTRGRRDQRGVTAVEFGLIAVPLFMMVFGTLEVGFAFFRASMLESGVQSASRAIRVGTLASQNDPVAAFRTALCQVAITLPCDQIAIESVSYSTYEEALGDEPDYDEDGNLVPRGFDLGEANQIMTVRVVFRHRFITPLIGRLIQGQVNGELRLASTAIFQNEPWDDDFFR